MVQFTYTAAVLYAASLVLAIPSPLTPDPAGTKNIGNGVGAQFIGGACLSSADCASTCCAFLAGAGICSGLGAQFQAGKQGCGFGDGGAAPAASGAATTTAAAAASTAASSSSGGTDTIDTSLPGAQNVGLANGSQFITGQCFSDADCASGCCANPKGVCSGPDVSFDAGKQGCGFTASGTTAAAAAADPAVAASPSATAAAASSGTDTIDTSLPGAQNVGLANGSQFITGQCFSDADCASGCCAKPKGVCSGPAVSFDAGKEGCGFTAVAARDVLPWDM
ncbi:hypothetical protein BX600DRAFT_437168 [Xylariales sp. PMI_506]|nr:hypothetical protein BX600DRAFT_437168 [Xylariales sp. PMI_506]